MTRNTQQEAHILGIKSRILNCVEVFGSSSPTAQQLSFIAKLMIEDVMIERLGTSNLRHKHKSDAFFHLQQETTILLIAAKEDFFNVTDKAAQIYIKLQEVIRDHFCTQKKDTIVFSTVAKDGSSFYEMAAIACDLEAKMECNQHAISIGRTVFSTLGEEKYREGRYHIDAEDWALFKRRLSYMLEPELPVIRQSNKQAELMEKLATTLAKEFFKAPIISLTKKETITFKSTIKYLGDKELHLYNNFEKSIAEVLFDFIGNEYALSDLDKAILSLSKSDNLSFLKHSFYLGEKIDIAWMSFEISIHQQTISTRNHILPDFLQSPPSSLFKAAIVAASGQSIDLLRYLLDTKAIPNGLTISELTAVFNELYHTPLNTSLPADTLEKIIHRLILSDPKFTSHVALFRPEIFSTPLKKHVFGKKLIDKNAAYALLKDTLEKNDLSCLKALLPHIYLWEDAVEKLDSYITIAMTKQLSEIEAYLSDQRLFLNSPSSTFARTIHTLLLSSGVSLEEAAFLTNNAAKYLTTQGITVDDIPNADIWRKSIQDIFPLFISANHKFSSITESKINLPLEVTINVAAQLMTALSKPFAEIVSTWAMTRTPPYSCALTAKAFFEYLDVLASAKEENQSAWNKQALHKKAPQEKTSTPDRVHAFVVQHFADLYAFAQTLDAKNGFHIALDTFLLTPPTSAHFDAHWTALKKATPLALETSPKGEVSVQLSMLYIWLGEETSKVWLKTQYTLGKSPARIFNLRTENLLTETEKVALSSLPLLATYFEKAASSSFFSSHAAIATSLNTLIDAFKSGSKETIETAKQQLIDTATLTLQEFPDLPKHQKLSTLCTLLDSPRFENVLKYVILSGKNLDLDGKNAALSAA